MKRLAIYASGKCTRIKKTIQKYPEVKNKIIFIVNDDEQDSDLGEYFGKSGINYFSFDYKSLSRDNDRNLLLSNYILEKLDENNIDFCLSFGGHILKGVLLEKYNRRLINVHPGIIPEVIGLHAIDKALAENKRFIGNTVHFIDSGVDSGPIIMQNIVLAENFEKYGYDLFLDQQIDLIYKTVKLLEEDRIRIVNNKAIIEGADYTVSRIFPDFNC